MDPPEFKPYQKSESQSQQQNSQTLLEVKPEPKSQSTPVGPSPVSEDQPLHSQGELMFSQQRRQRVTFSQASYVDDEDERSQQDEPDSHLLSQWPSREESQHHSAPLDSFGALLMDSSPEEASPPSSQRHHKSQSQFPMTQAFSETSDPSPPLQLASEGGNSQEILLQEILLGDQSNEMKRKEEERASQALDGSPAEDNEIALSGEKGAAENSGGEIELLVEPVEEPSEEGEKEEEEEISGVPSTPSLPKNSSANNTTPGTSSTSKTIELFENEMSDPHQASPLPHRQQEYKFVSPFPLYLHLLTKSPLLQTCSGECGYRKRSLSGASAISRRRRLGRALREESAVFGPLSQPLFRAAEKPD